MGVESVELLRWDPRVHADGVTDIPSVLRPVEASDL